MVPARDAITALVNVYAERVDAGDLEGVAALFADATYGADGGPERRGTAQVLGALRDAIILHDGVPRTKHVITNLTIEVDEDAGTATARSYFTVLQATATLPLQPILAGRYHDRFARGAGGWRFAERRIFIDLVGELGEHVRLRR
jgi:3-phenylpropionate/cinnamic acid dioxygenase small subunit